MARTSTRTSTTAKSKKTATKKAAKPVAKKTATRKTTVRKPAAKTTKKAIRFQVGLHLPGQLPSKVSANSETTFGEFAKKIMDEYNVHNYSAFLISGGESHSLRNARKQLLRKGDLIRIGVKTKNNS